MPLLLASGEVQMLPDSNIGKALALLVLLAMIAQPIVTKLMAKSVTEKQTAVIQTGTDAQTVLIVGSLEDVRHEVKRVREAQARADEVNGITKIALADQSVRNGEFKKRLGVHDEQIKGHGMQIEDLHQRVTTIEKGRKA